jgi:NAD-dependent deacetylase sirtuin 4
MASPARACPAAAPPATRPFLPMARSLELASSCDALLAVGTSLQVFSAYRIVQAAVERGARLAIVNVGPTRADHMATLKASRARSEPLPAV